MNPTTIVVNGHGIDRFAIDDDFNRPSRLTGAGYLEVIPCRQ
jgi:hypothetical protein